MVLEKYTSNWVKNFASIKREIEVVLDEIKYSIEHIGSTAVPHLDSKPIIDIDIIYSNPSDFDLIKLKLEKLGYVYHGNQGIEGREVFKRNGNSTNQILDSIKHHLYVCHTDNRALERHILSRNFLRKNEWARLKYQQMKYDLAEKAHQDRKAYATLKEIYVNDFIDLIIAEEKINTQQTIHKSNSH